MKTIVVSFLLSILLSGIYAQTTGLKSYTKISDTQGSFTGTLDNSDLFGYAVEGIGDLDGDGIEDVAVNAYLDDEGNINAGAVWILFLNLDGTVKSHQKIANNTGGLGSVLDNTDTFGNAIENIGDLNEDGITDLAVGAYFDDDGGTNKGCIYILFMNTDGTVDSYQKVSDTQGSFTGTIDVNDFFGSSIANIGDLDGDGVTDLAVGAINDEDGGSKRGAVWILFMDTDGTVDSYQKISDTQGSFTGVLDYDDRFGASVESLGDLDKDGVIDIAVGAYYDDDGATNTGAVWILFLDSDGTVQSYSKISDTSGGFDGDIDGSDAFGASLQYMTDFDLDGDINLMVSAINDDDGATDKGAIWILNLSDSGTVDSSQKISDTQGNFSGNLDAGDNFGHGVSMIGDINNDGLIEFGIGTRKDDDGGTDRGALYIITFNGPVTEPPLVNKLSKISDTEGNFTGTLDNSDNLGVAVEGLGDLDGDGIEDIVVNGYLDDDDYTDAGAIWVLFLNEDGSVKSHQKIANNTGGLGDELGNTVTFGNDIENIGDLDGDGVIDLAVGSWLADDGGTNKGLVYILFMNTDGTVDSYQKIGAVDGGFTGTLDYNDLFGTSITNVGDLDGDGVTDLAVGARGDEDGGSARGAVWILFMNTDGTVDSHQKISDTQGGFTGTLEYDDRFACSIESLGDLNGDGVKDIVVGAYYDDDGATNTGAIWVLFLNSDGTVDSHQKISATSGDFPEGMLDGVDVFGASILCIGDINGDGNTNLLIGATNDDDGGTDRGAVWNLELGIDGKVNSYKKISATQGGFSDYLANSDKFGRSLAEVGDLNNDGVSEIVVGAHGDDDGGIDRGTVYILEFNKLNYTDDGYYVINETSNSLGAIVLEPNFGMPPYLYYWEDGSQAKNRYDLEAGVYNVTIKDTLSDSLELIIPVGFDLEWIDVSGVATTANNLTKTVADGWTNGLASLNNLVLGEGEVMVTIDELGKAFTYGYNLYTNDQAEEYFDMDFAMYVDTTDTLYIWEDSTLTNQGLIAEGDLLSIERTATHIVFKKNNVALSQVTEGASNAYRADFSLYNSQMTYRKPPTATFPAFRVTGEVTHNSLCYSNKNGTGAIDISLNGGVGCHASGSTTYLWQDEDENTVATTEDVTGLAAGEYKVTVTFCNGTKVSKSFEIGYYVNWTKEEEVEPIVDSELTNNYGSDGYGNSGASSNNILTSGVSGWLEFTVSMDETSKTNSLAVGLSSSDDNLNKLDIDYGLVFNYTTLGSKKYRYITIIDDGVETGGAFTGNAGSFRDTDKFKIIYDAANDQITYERNGVALKITGGAYSGMSFIASPFVSETVPEEDYIIDVALAEDGEGIVWAAASFGCQFDGYATLTKKLNAGFYTTVDRHLLFQYIEEYAVTGEDLEAKIYDEQREEESSIPVKTISKVGANYYDMDLSAMGLTTNAYYVLEVTNDKNETFLLRFLYQ